ncbi:response regulator transcription factor [Terrabacter sp. AAH1]|jgi:DNA-binding CsgD family transcriptional regulator
MEPTGAMTKSRWTLTDQDVGGLLDVLEPGPAVPADDIFYPDVLAGLRRLIPCDELNFQLMDVGDQRIRLLSVGGDGVEREENFGTEDDEFTRLFWQEFWKFDGCAGPLLSNDYTTVQRRSDRWTTRDYANTPLGSVFVNMLGITHEVLVPFTPHGGTDRRVLLFRHGGPDFSERELMMLRLVRPHLAELHARREREVRGEPNLTPRQWEILRQVATGASNARIARNLRLSEGTVRKHLENIFLRLDVLSRTEALARVRPFLDVA